MWELCRQPVLVFGLLKGRETHRDTPQMSFLVCIWISGNIFLAVWASFSFGHVKQLIGVMEYGWWKGALRCCTGWALILFSLFKVQRLYNPTFHWHIVDASLLLFPKCWRTFLKKHLRSWVWFEGDCSALKFQQQFLLFHFAFQAKSHWWAGERSSRGGKLLPCCWWRVSLKASPIWEESADKVITAFSVLCPPTLPFRWPGVGMHYSTWINPPAEFQHHLVILSQCGGCSRCPWHKQ